MATFRVKKDKDNPYVMINRHVLYNSNLTFKAKGILNYFLSRPDDWEFYLEEIASHSTDGIDSIRTGIKELIENGYIVREQKRNENGKFKGYEYVVYEIPQETSPEWENPISEKPVSENPTLLNKDIKLNKEYIYTFWNEQKIIEHKKLTEKTKRTINGVLKDYSEQEIVQAITNYKKVLTGTEYYWNHKWTLEEFLKRGLEKFLDWEVCSNNFKKKDNNFNHPTTPSKANAGAYEEI